LYKDSICFEKLDTMTLLNQGCYANRYDNTTKAFDLKVIVFEDSPLIDVREYLWDCEDAYQYGDTVTIEVGKCQKFVGGFYAITSLKESSTTCEGSSCSTLSYAVQRFYSEEDCQGLVTDTFTYPALGECLRWSNGTQTFSLLDGLNISQVDYPLNDGCNGAETTKYYMKSGTCYSLNADEAPLSFSWTVEGAAAVADARRQQRLTPSIGQFLLGLFVLSIFLPT